MSQVLDLLINLKIGIGGAIGLGEVCEGIVEVMLPDLFFKVREDEEVTVRRWAGSLEPTSAALIFRIT